MKEFLKRLAGFSLGPIIGAIISVAQIPIMTRLMTTGDYGIFSFFKTLIFQIPVFLCIGLDQSFVREYNTSEKKIHIFQHAVMLPLLTGLIFFAISIGFSGPISDWMFGRDDEKLMVILGGLWCLMGVVERFIYLIIRMEERALAYSRMAISIKSTVFVLSLALLLAGIRSYHGPILGLVLGNVSIDLFLLYRFRKFFDFRTFEKDRVLFKRMLVYGIPLILVIALQAGLNTIDNIFIHTFATKDDLGVYNAGLSIVNLFSLITTTFANFWIPTALRWYESDKDIKHYSFIADALLALLTAIYFALMAVSPLVSKILGEKYMDVEGILGLLAMRHIMTIMSETTNLGITFQRRTHYNLIISILTFIPGLVINMILTPKIGYQGAAIATAISFVVFYFARTLFSRRCGFKIPQIKQTVTIALMMLAGIWTSLGMGAAWMTTLLCFLGCIFVQLPTLKIAKEIHAGRENWDFR